MYTTSGDSPLSELPICNLLHLCRHVQLLLLCSKACSVLLNNVQYLLSHLLFEQIIHLRQLSNAAILLLLCSKTWALCHTEEQCYPEPCTSAASIQISYHKHCTEQNAPEVGCGREV